MPLKVVCIALLAGFAARAQAADEDHFALSIGPFQAATDTRIRVDAAGIGGTHISLEDDLGLDDEERLWYVKAKIRVTHRQRLLLDYYDLDRDATRVIDRHITFQGEVFPIRANVATHMDFRLGAVRYEYAFLNREQFMLAGSLGVHIAEVSAELRSLDVAVSEDASTDGAAPVAGLRFLYTPSPHWRIGAHVDYFTAHVNDIDASLTRAGGAVEWRFARHFGVYVGYDFFHLDAEYDDDDWQGKFDLKVDGPIAGVTLAF